MGVVRGRMPLALRELLASDDAEVVALAQQIAALPPADPLCPFCIVLSAREWPEFTDEKLCREHLAVFRALQCKGWNADRWHQHLAALARWGKLPSPVEWWPGAASDSDLGGSCNPAGDPRWEPF